MVVRCCDGLHCLGWHSAAIGVGCTRTDCSVPGRQGHQNRREFETFKFPLKNEEGRAESNENEDPSLENGLQSEGRESNGDEDSSLENELKSVGGEVNENEDPSLENGLQSEGRESNRDEDPSLENGLQSEGGESNRDDDPSLENELQSEGEESNEDPDPVDGNDTHQDFESTVFPFKESDEDIEVNKQPLHKPNKDPRTGDDLREYEEFFDKDTSLENQLKSEGKELNEIGDSPHEDRDEDSSLENELKSEGRELNENEDPSRENGLQSEARKSNRDEDSSLQNEQQHSGMYIIFSY